MNKQVFLSTICCSGKLIKNPQRQSREPLIHIPSEAQITTWTCGWHLKWRLLGEWCPLPVEYASISREIASELIGIVGHPAGIQELESGTLFSVCVRQSVPDDQPQ